MTRVGHPPWCERVLCTVGPAGDGSHRAAPVRIAEDTTVTLVQHTIGRPTILVEAWYPEPGLDPWVPAGQVREPDADLPLAIETAAALAEALNRLIDRSWEDR